MRFKYDKNKKTNKVFALAGLMALGFLGGGLHNKHTGTQFGDDTNIFGKTNRWIETTFKQKNCVNNFSSIDVSSPPTNENTRTKRVIESIQQSKTGNDYIQQADEKDVYICDGDKDLPAVAEFNRSLGIIHLKPMFKLFMNEITLSHEFHHHSQFQNGVFIENVFEYRVQDMMAMIMAFEVTADVAAMVVTHELNEKKHPTAWKQNFVSFHDRSSFVQKLKDVFNTRYEQEIANDQSKDNARLIAAKQTYETVFENAIVLNNQMWNRTFEQSLQYVVGAIKRGLTSKNPKKMPKDISRFGELPNGKSFTNGMSLPEFCHVTAGIKGIEQLINTLEDIRSGINPAHLASNEKRYGIFQRIDLQKAEEIFESGNSKNMMYYALIMSTGLSFEQSLKASKPDLIKQCHPDIKRRTPAP